MHDFSLIPPLILLSSNAVPPQNCLEAIDDYRQQHNQQHRQEIEATLRITEKHSYRLISYNIVSIQCYSDGILIQGCLLTCGGEKFFFFKLFEKS